MLTCYLDDSDNDRGPVMALGGYVQTDITWTSFEVAAGELLSRYQVKTLHGKDFDAGRGPFKHWPGSKKATFVDDLYRIAGAHSIVGAISVVDKEDFKNLRAVGEFSNLSPLGVAFSSLVSNMILKDFADWPMGEDLRVSFVVESGHQNNGNLVRYFDWLKKNPIFSNRLGTISFTGKHDCVAIQLADFLAFHTRKAAQGWRVAGYPKEMPTGNALDIMQKYAPHRLNRHYGDSLDRSMNPFKMTGINIGGITSTPNVLVTPPRKW